MNQERVFQVLVGPHVSEKAAIVADENNQFVFKVGSTPSNQSKYYLHSGDISAQRTRI